MPRLAVLVEAGQLGEVVAESVPGGSQGGDRPWVKLVGDAVRVALVGETLERALSFEESLALIRQVAREMR